MGIFNYIDTFFFISLGITFVLILLLVFHFKQRISDLEDKTQTMFEIINNIVKELSLVKNNCCCCNSRFTQIPKENFMPFHLNCAPGIFSTQNEKIIVSDDEEEEEDEEDDEADDDADDEEDNDTDDDDDDVDREDDDEGNNIKIVNLDVTDSVELNEVETILEETYHTVETAETEEKGPIQIDTSKEMYKKMTIQALKNLVVTKGLSGDANKLKKNELIKLLEQNEE